MKKESIASHPSYDGSTLLSWRASNTRPLCQHVQHVLISYICCAIEKYTNCTVCIIKCPGVRLDE